MQPWLEDEWGNASTREYRMGWTASEAVEEARDAVAEFVGGKSDQIVFTSGGTESICAAIKSFVGYANWEESKIVTCATEHAAVLAPCKRLQELTKIELTAMSVDRHGLCKLDDLRRALDTTKRCLVVIMAANNEIGTIQPVEELGPSVGARHLLTGSRRSDLLLFQRDLLCFGCRETSKEIHYAKIASE